jgi:hypothetical protein
MNGGVFGGQVKSSDSRRSGGQREPTHECLSNVAISMKFAGMVSVTRRGKPSMLL